MLRPQAPVRRFDVFAEYTRLEKFKEGFPPDVAKGYAIWLAKVVAGRKFGLIKPGLKPKVGVREELAERKPKKKFRSLGGVEQTDKTFEKEIVERMGRDFYQKVFSPAIEEAFRSGKTYKQIRDTIRNQWRP